MIKIVFVDIDNTLYSWKTHKWDKKSISMLNKMQRNGTLIFISTSRPYPSLKEFGALEKLHPDGIITFNGGAISYKDKILYCYEYPKEIIESIIQIANKYKLSVELCGYNCRFMATKYNKYSNLYFKEFVDSIPEFQEYKDQKVVSLLLCCDKQYDEQILPLISEKCHYYRFGNYGVDIHYKPFYKGDAVAKVLEYLKMKPEDAAAFGDEQADVSMFKNVKYGIALGNSNQCVKDQAFYVTKPVWKHGVYKAIKHLKLHK